jgi:hypothetical protein
VVSLGVEKDDTVHVHYTLLFDKFPLYDGDNLLVKSKDTGKFIPNSDKPWVITVKNFHGANLNLNIAINLTE